jgi:hypothetical protein
MRHHQIRFLCLTGAVLLTAGLWTPARAQDPDDLRRGVARISYMDGEVSVRRGDSGEWVAGVINAPLLSEDSIATGPNSRAEVQFDAGNVMRVGGNSQLKLADLEYSRYQVQLAHGTVTYRMLRASSANVELDTPSVSVRPSQQGSYRISVRDGGDSEITARNGNVEIFTPRGSQWLNAGQTMTARGTSADPEFQIAAAIPYDDWDRWCDGRDRPVLQSKSYQYVPQGVYGAEDLDNAGVWTEVPNYGPCWRPTTVGVGWAPYQNGRWVWLDWYGWTWVSYDSWGWAPYHYGRWFWETNFGWLWYPGVMGVRHYWSPALVGWFGFGAGGGFGFGFGNVGWVPLAPYEVFHPWWGRGFYGRGGFNRNINITNVNVNNVYRNARVMNGVSAVSASDFRSGRFNQIQRISGNQVRSAGMVRGAMPFAPGRDNLRFSDRAVTNVPRTSNTQFFSHQQPTPAPRTSMGPQSRQFEQGNRGTVPSQSGFRQGTALQQGPQASSRGGSNPAVNTGGGGWRRFNEPAGQSAAPRNGNSGWGGSQSQALQNTRPSGGQSTNQAPAQRGSGYSRFGDPGTASRQQFTQSPRSQSGGSSGFGSYSAPRYNAPTSRQESIRIAPPVVRERQSAPSYSAPHNSGGGGGGGRPSGGGGGGGGHSSGGSGGGGHHR